jgi:hypothetical protein
MQTSTMREAAPGPNLQDRVNGREPIEPEPVFQLTHEMERDPARATVGATLKLDEDPDVGVRTSRRQVFVRIAGLLALVTALVGSGLVFGSAAAGRPALSWVTLGYADVVLGPAR